MRGKAGAAGLVLWNRLREIRVYEPMTAFAALNKKGLDTVIDAALVAVDSLEKLGRLQFQAAKSLFRETASNLAGGNSLAHLSPEAAMVGAAGVEKVLGYSRNFFDIASGSAVQMLDLIHSGSVDLRKGLTVLLDGMNESMAMGNNGATVTALKSVMSTSEALMEGLTKTAKQSIELAESAFRATANIAADTAKAPAAGNG